MKIMKVLVVDDKKENLYLLERMLEKIGHEVEIAENGKEALEKLQINNYEIVISDILMPVMDGFQLCKTVKSDKRFADLLFIFYTATYVEKKDEEFALSLGADKFLRKPLDPEIFIETINEIIQHKESSHIEPRKAEDKEEREVLKLYNERLIHKLEKKVLDLEKEIILRKKSEKKYRDTLSQAELYKDLLDHDINNILQILLSGIQLFKEISDEPKQQTFTAEIITMILIQVRRAERLISNVRKLSQFDMKKINLENFALTPILEKVVLNSKSSYFDRKLDIEIELLDGNLHVQANKFLEDAFLNIIDNAITHNKNSIVRIRIKVTQEQIKSKKYVKIEFTDNGIGINDSRKEKVFHRQGTEYSTGLGLSLVNRIVDSINGKVWVENRVSRDHTKGSNFSIIIPSEM